MTAESFGGKASALAWLEAENQVLLKVVALAASAGFDAHAWQLPVVLWTYHNVCGHWHDGARLHRLALAAAERCGDLSGQAYALRGLGSFAMSVGNFAEAHECLSAAQSAFASLGDDLGLARTDVILGQTLEYQGRYGEALAVISAALSLSSGCAPEDPNMALVRASRAERLGLEQRPARGAVDRARELPAGDRAVPGDRLLPRRGRHLGHPRRG